MLVLSASPLRAQDRQDSRTVTGNTTFTLPVGGTISASGRFLSIKNTGTTPVVNPRIVVNGKNWRTAADIVSGVVTPGMTDEQKARALWTFARENRYHWWPPTAGLDARDAVKLFNGYGYGFCSDVADALAALIAVAGLPSRQWVLGNSEHSVTEAFYDNAWHLYDVDREGLYLRWDNHTVASVLDLIADPALIARAGPSHLDLVDIYQRTPTTHWSTDVVQASHTLALTLRPQEELRLFYRGFASYQDDSGLGGPPPPIYANGLITTPFDPAASGARSVLTGARDVRLLSEDALSPGASPTAVALNGDLVFRVKSPYPVVGVKLDGDFRRLDPADVVEIATARNGGALNRNSIDLAYGLFAVDGFLYEAANLATFSQDQNWPALHANGVGAPSTLTYRMRPLPDAQGRILVGGTFFRHSAADDVRVLVSPDGIAWQTVWTATQTGYFRDQADIGPVVSSWNTLHVRFSFTASTSFWMVGADSISLEGVEPLVYRAAWTSSATDPTGSFARSVDLTATTAWPGSAPLYEFLVRVRLRAAAAALNVGVDDLTIATTVQVAPWSLPVLNPGTNQVVYADDTSASHEVLVTQAWTERSGAQAPTAPAAPMYPANDSHITVRGTLPLVWQRSTNSTGAPIYRYQAWVCDSAVCTSPLTASFEFFLHNVDAGADQVFGTADDGAARTPLPQVMASVGSMLEPGRRYYWRVRAQDYSLEWSPWSTTWSFTVDQTNAAPDSGPTATIGSPATALYATDATDLVMAGSATSSAAITAVRWVTDAGVEGTASGTTSWTIPQVPLHPDDNLVAVLATDSLGRTGFASLAVTQGGTLTSYILPEGATGSFFGLDVVLANPNDSPIDATARFLVEGGNELSLRVSVGGNSRRRIRVDDVPGVEGASVSTVVTTTSPLPLIVERTMSWNANAYGAHGGRAISAPSRRWLFAEGSQGYFDTFILLANTNGVAANATISFYLEGGGRVDRTYVVGATSRLTIYAGAIAPLVGRSFAFELNADVPITAERTCYFGTARMWDGGHSSTGATEPSTRWFHAEGATGPFFDTFVLIGNSNSTTAHVVVTYLTSAGATVVRHHDVAAHGRLTLNIATEDAALTNEAIATIVDSDVPIVSERVTYWPAPRWAEGSISLGATAAALRWGVADGRAGGERGAQTYILIANPDTAHDAAVQVRFLTADDQPIVRQYIVPAGRRFTLQAAVEAPALDGGEFGAVIESTNGIPIFVVRATYWDALGETWAAGTSVPGTPLP